jgi:hypothetical protein
LQYLRKVLARQYKLSFEERDKSVVDVDDVYALLEHHWADDTYVYEDERQRLQTDALILIASYTGSRPGALVYNPSNEKISLATRQEVGELAAMLPDRKWNGITYRFVELWLSSICDYQDASFLFRSPLTSPRTCRHKDPHNP